MVGILGVVPRRKRDCLALPAAHRGEIVTLPKDGHIPSLRFAKGQYGSVNVFCHCELKSEAITGSVCHIVFPTGLS